MKCASCGNVISGSSIDVADNSPFSVFGLCLPCRLRKRGPIFLLVLAIAGGLAYATYWWGKDILQP